MCRQRRDIIISLQWGRDVAPRDCGSVMTYIGKTLVSVGARASKQEVNNDSTFNEDIVNNSISHFKVGINFTVKDSLLKMISFEHDH